MSWQSQGIELWLNTWINLEQGSNEIAIARTGQNDYWSDIYCMTDSIFCQIERLASHHHELAGVKLQSNYANCIASQTYIAAAAISHGR